MLGNHPDPIEQGLVIERMEAAKAAAHQREAV
jgi:hypothetical protein